MGPAVGLRRRLRAGGRRIRVFEPRHRPRRGARPDREPGRQVDHRAAPGDPHTAAWYHMLETIRQYGAERLTDGGGGARVAGPAPRPLSGGRRGCSRPRASDPTRRTGSSGCGASRATSGRPWSSASNDPMEAAAAYDIAAQIWNSWFAGFLREGYRYLTRALGLEPRRPRPGPADWRPPGAWPCSRPTSSGTRRCSPSATRSPRASTTRCCWLASRSARGQATLYQGDIPGSIELLEQARREFQALGNALGEFDTLILLTAWHVLPGGPRGTTSSAGRRWHSLRDTVPQSSTAYALWAVGIAQWRAGDFDQATRSLRRCSRGCSYRCTT